MKNIVIIILSMVGTLVYSQDEGLTFSKKEQKALAKEQRKAKKIEQIEQAKTLTELMLKHQKFVLEADYLGNQRGQRIPVTSSLNFVIVDSTMITLQLGSNEGIGANGVGGITLNGRITKYELKKNEGKKGTSYFLIINLLSSLGSYDISLTVSSYGNADATVRGNVSGQLRYYGRLVPISKSRVYKGSSI